MTERPDPETVGQALEVRREAEAVGMPLPAMDDSELSRLWRTARALAESRLFKDATQASQAFAKIIAGRDLGLTPFEAMGSLHIVEGKIEAGGDLHATRVRSREGYDFRVAWIKEDEHGREAVYASQDKATDLREVVGCAIEFLMDGEVRGVSRWTIEDSERAGLLKPSRNGAPSNHKRYPRNMFFNRAMTNGVAWYVPEVMGGMRVYGLGEVEANADDLTASDRGPIGSEKADDLPTAVEAVVARASELGHRGLANREAAAIAVGGQSQEDVDAWIKNATQELNRLAAGKPEPANLATAATDASGLDSEHEPPDAEVVDRTGEEERAAAALAGLADADWKVTAPADTLVKLRERATELQEDAEGFAETDPELAQELRDKADELRAEADAMDDGAQGELL